MRLVVIPNHCAPSPWFGMLIRIVRLGGSFICVEILAHSAFGRGERWTIRMGGDLCVPSQWSEMVVRMVSSGGYYVVQLIWPCGDFDPL